MHKHNSQRGTLNFVAIQVIRGSGVGATEEGLGQIPQPQPRSKLNLSSAMKLFHRFRKVIMRLMLSVPSRRSSSDSRHRNSNQFEPPKTSCSSYYSSYSYSHYNEAIADCIEFFNKSAQDGILDGWKSDVVWVSQSQASIIWYAPVFALSYSKLLLLFITFYIIFLLSRWHISDCLIECIWEQLLQFSGYFHILFQLCFSHGTMRDNNMYQIIVY